METELVVTVEETVLEIDVEPVTELIVEEDPAVELLEIGVQGPAGTVGGSIGDAEINGGFF